MPAAKKTPPRSAKTARKEADAMERAASGARVTDALAEAAWTEADDALAQALAELDELDAAADEHAREAAMALLSQSLARAGRKRGLTRIGALGATEPFDPQRHDLSAAAVKTPKMVRILARGVARGADVLVRARVGPVRRKGEQ